LLLPARSRAWWLGQAVGEKMRMRADIEMPPEYQGRVVSRSKALGSAGRAAGRKEADESESEGDDADSDGDEGAEDGEMEEEEEEGGEEEEDSDADEDGGDDEDEEDEEEEEEESGRGEEEEEASDVEALEAAQAANLIKLVQVESKDKEKAQHARNQRALSDTVLEARIRLQKPLALAARLPRGPAMQAFVESGGRADTSLAQAARECRSEARELLEEFLALRSALWAQTPALPTPGAWATRGADEEGDGGGAGGKRKREEELAGLWERLVSADREMDTFRDATIDKWNAKVLLACCLLVACV
jgi:protein AATF/BFR2